MGWSLYLRLLIRGVVSCGLMYCILTRRASLSDWQECPFFVNSRYQDVIQQIRFLMAREVLASTDGSSGSSNPFLCQFVSRDLVLFIHPARPGVLFDAIVAAESGPSPIVSLIVASCLL